MSRPLHERCARGARRGLRGARRRGVTLVEILIVLAVVALVTGGVMAGTGQLAGARLKQSSTLIAGAVRVGYVRATATSKSVRLVFDLGTSEIWLEEADRPMLVTSNDRTATGGAEAATEAEREAIEEGDRIVKGPRIPKPEFHAVEETSLSVGGTKGKRKLPSGVRVRSVHTSHDAEPRTEGRAYLYFWPGGTTERAVVALDLQGARDTSQALSLVVAPLTGKVTVRSGVEELVTPEDEAAASEREDRGP